MLTFTPEKATVDTTQVFIATFDQRVDPAAVIKTITVNAAGAPVAIRPATTAEIVSHDRIHQISDDTPDGRWIAFRPTDPIANGTKLDDLDRAGHALRRRAAHHTGRVHPHGHDLLGARRSRMPRCGYGEGCRPQSSFFITFNNTLDPKAFDQSEVKITPALAASIGVQGNTLTINGATKSDTRYVVQLPASLRDEFGQTLGAPQSKTFEVGEATPALIAFPRPLTTTDPSAQKPSVSVTSVGHRTLQVDVYAADPSQWLAYQDITQRWGSNYEYSVPNFRRLSTTTITVDGGGHELTESPIDLSSDLHGATGDVVVVVSPTEQLSRNDNNYWANQPTITWVQVTAIGVDALSTNDQLITWATNLRDGTPLSGVRVQLGGTDKSAVTDADGLARVDIARARYLTATKGADVAILPADSEYEWNRHDSRRFGHRLRVRRPRDLSPG